MRKQPRWVKVTYKSKTHGGRTYGRRYAKTASYPPMQAMQKDLRAAFSGQMFDADQRVAYPTLVCELLGTKCPEPIINYVDNREDILKDCMDATGLTRDKVKPLYNIPLFADEQWILPYWETKHKTRIKEPYRTEFLAYMQACRKARSILLNAFPRFIEIARYEKKTNIRGSALSYMLGTVEDVVTEDARVFFNRFPRYDPAVLIFDGLQVKVLKKMDESGIKQVY